MQFTKKLLLLVCFSSLLLQVCFSQSLQLDSLRVLIKQNTSYDKKIIALKKITDLLVTKDFSECIDLANQGIELAQKNNDNFSQAYFKKQIGLSNYFKGNFDTAAVCYYDAINILKNNTTKSKKDVDLLKASILNEMGKLYRKTKDLKRALQHYDEAYAIHKQQNNLDGMATILNESGVVFEYENNYTEAISRYKKSLAIREKMKDLLGQSYSLNFIGGAYTLQKKYQEAESNLLESLKLRQQLKDSFSIALSYTDLAYMYADKGDLTKATESYTQSNVIAQKLKYKELVSGNYKELANIAEKQGNQASALNYIKLHYALKDSIYNEAKMQQIEQLNAKYQTEKKEQQIKEQQYQITKRNYLLLGTAIFLLLLSALTYSFYKRKKLQHEARLQEAIIKQQDIATKAVLDAEEKERERIARDLHDGVGQVMSAAKMNLSSFENELNFKDENQKLKFEKAISLVDEGCKEVRNVSHQMMPNALLKAGLSSAIKEFIDKIESKTLKVNLYTEGLNERLDNNIETVLYRVIQECVNNVIKHSGANQLDISLIKDDDGISATIEDNGKGFDSKAKIKNEGIGVNNIKARVEFLKGTVDFDSAEGKGTLVAIHVPVGK
ncbi:MAG: sensor histidine kinase [Ferruginibacter sp.]|nr:sensor histidine kinase [Ferruginibacter sp.]